MNPKTDAAALALATAAASPFMADWQLILLGAFCGAFWAMTRSELTLGKACLAMMGSVAMALALTGALAIYIGDLTGKPASIWLTPVAGILGAFNDSILKFSGSMVKRFAPDWIKSKVG